MKEQIYWTDWNTKSIYQANKMSSTSQPIELIDKLNFPMGITVLHPLRQAPLAPERNRCADHACSHICLPNNESYRCACPAPYQLAPDAISCRIPSDAFMLIARRTDIQIM